MNSFDDDARVMVKTLDGMGIKVVGLMPAKDGSSVAVIALKAATNEMAVASVDQARARALGVPLATALGLDVLGRFEAGQALSHLETSALMSWTLEEFGKRR